MADKKCYTFDIEGNNLFPAVDKVHCLVAKDWHTGEVYRFDPSNIEDGIKFIAEADYLLGHNIIDYDARTIGKIFSNIPIKAVMLDTLTFCKVTMSNRKELDEKLIVEDKLTKEDFQYKNAKNKTLSMQGRHSLKSYGVRLGFAKGDYGDNRTDWSTYEPEMLDYCEQDVELNHALAKITFKKFEDFPEDAYFLELEVQRILSEQSTLGWYFNKTAAEKLYAELAGRRAELIAELQSIFPVKKETMKVPEFYFAHTPDGNYWREENKKTLEDEIYYHHRDTEDKLTRSAVKLLIESGPLKIREMKFNPSSAVDVADGLKWKHGWEPFEYNRDGSPRCGVEVLEQLDFPEAKLLLELAGVQDAIEKLAEGQDGGYLAHCDENFRVHGYIDPLGTNTHRGAHRNPNLGQVTSSAKPYGKELRSLFIVPAGYKLLGTDASAQELRILSQIMSEYDGGEYIREATEGDIHTKNQLAIGVDSRATAKTFFYAFLYGAGDWKIGVTVGVDNIEEFLEEHRDTKIIEWDVQGDVFNKKFLPARDYALNVLPRIGKPIDDRNIAYVIKGKLLKDAFLKNLPAIKKSIQKCKQEGTKFGYVTSLDGRKIYIRAMNAALNCLIQSSGAVICKRWMVIIDEKLREAGIKEYVQQVGWIHDEIQFQVKAEYAERLGEICQEAMAEVQRYYGYMCPLDADYKIGNSWYETH